MMLSDFFTRERVSLDLAGDTREDVLGALVALLQLDERSGAKLSRTLRRRESLGSTGIGRGIAIPHCRSLVVRRLRLAYGRHRTGIDFGAIDDRPVHHFFLIVAPPVEVSGQYLPVLGKLAQFAKNRDVPARLANLRSANEFLDLLESRSA